MPTERDVYKPERWLDDALFAPEVRAAWFRLVEQGWLDALRQIHGDATIYTFWDYFRNAFARNAGLRIDHFLLSPPLASDWSTRKSMSRCAGGTRPATTRRCGSSWRRASTARSPGARAVLGERAHGPLRQMSLRMVASAPPSISHLAPLT
jgi:hypothetical protein